MPFKATTPYLFDGYATTLAFSLDPFIAFFEREVTPPGLSQGGAIDVSTMRDLLVKHKAPKSLTNIERVHAVVAYSSNVYDTFGIAGAVASMIGVNQRLAITFPDGAVLLLFGWLEEFRPGALKEGDLPTAEIVFEISNIDDTGAEVVLLGAGSLGYTTGAGTPPAL